MYLATVFSHTFTSRDQLGGDARLPYVPRLLA